MNPAALSCPRCTAPMQLLSLASHRGAHVQLQVEHCAACRLVWFDALESVALHPQGWLTLLRAMEEGAAEPLPQPLNARLRCLHCPEPLREVKNQSRYGRFAALECPNQHGHLQTQSGLLAERGLIRRLGAAEHEALAQRRLALHCLQCGAPAAARDAVCSFCTTALQVVDVPRLLHALAPPKQAMGDLPRQLAALQAWPCRGCGAPLDVGRHAQCPQCALPVLVDRLPDLHPLLDAAQQRLDAAPPSPLMAARPEAGAAVAGAVAAAGSSARYQPVGAAQAKRMASGWGNASLVCLGLLGLALALALLLGWPRDADWRLAQWRQQALTAQPGSNWALAAQYPADAPAPENLQERLLALELHLLLGLPLPEKARAGALLDGTLPGVAPALRDENWQALSALHLRAARTADALPRPAALADQAWMPAAPGVWVTASRRDLAVWHLELRNHGSFARWLGGVELLLGRAPKVLRWRCALGQAQAPATQWLASGAVGLLRCETPLQFVEVWDVVMEPLRLHATPELNWPSRMNPQRDGAAMARALDAAPRTGSRPALRGVDRWQALNSERRLALLAALALACWAVFVLLQRKLGRRRGYGLWLLVMLGPAWVFGAGHGVASLLLVAMALSLLALLGGLFLFLARLGR